MDSKKKAILELIGVILLFILFAYIVQQNIEFFSDLIGEGIIGMLIYVLMKIIAIVIAPVSTLALIIIATNLWGVVTAAVLSIIGWGIGAIIAFWIARKYGVSRVEKFVPLDKINRLEKRIPKKNIFWSVVFLRIIVPVDILSYALGLFSKIKTRDYILATFIGITPSAFIFAYIGGLPWYYQFILLNFAIIILLIGWIIINRKQ